MIRRPDAKPPANSEFLIRINYPEEEWEDLWELCQDIERLGGVRSDRGYIFATKRRRDAAEEMLADKWGTSYFESFGSSFSD